MPKITLDNLAGMIQNQFAEASKQLGDFKGEVNKRFDTVDQRFDKVDQEIKELKQGQENIELKVSNVAYRFELEEVKQRVMVLEQKLNAKK